MKCSYCKNPAKFKCICKETDFICSNHVGKHIKKEGPHNSEKLNIDLEPSRNSELKLKILKMLKNIAHAKAEITKITKSLTGLLDELNIQANKKLTEISAGYIKLLQHERFCKSEIPEIEEIEKMEIVVGNLNADHIGLELKKIYAKNLISETKASETKVNETKASKKKSSETRRIQFLNEHVGGFKCGAITADSKLLVTGGLDSTVRGWDLVEKKQVFAFYEHTSMVSCIALAEKNQNIISGSFDRSIRIWDIQEKKMVSVLRGHESSIKSICYSEKLSKIISGAFSENIFVWSYITFNLICKICTPTGVANTTLMKSQTSFFASCCPDIFLFDIETGAVLKTMTGHSTTAVCITFTDDEKIMVSGMGDGSIIIWDLINSKKLCLLKGHRGEITSLAFTQDGQLIVSVSCDCTVVIWDIKTGSMLNQFTENTYTNYCILRENQNFLTLSEDSSIGRLNIASRTYELSWFLKPFFYHNGFFSGDSRLIGYGTRNIAGIWDSESETEKTAFIGHMSIVLFVKISNDCNFALTCSRNQDQNLKYWNIETGQNVSVLRGHTNTVFCADFSKDGLKAASGSFDQSVRLWDLKNCSQEFEFKGHLGSIYSIKFLSNKELLVSGGGDCKVIIWNLKDRSQYAVFNNHERCVYLVLNSDDENYIISCNYFEGIKIWNVDEKRIEKCITTVEDYKNNKASYKIPLKSVKYFLKS